MGLVVACMLAAGYRLAGGVYECVTDRPPKHIGVLQRHVGKALLSGLAQYGVFPNGYKRNCL